MRTAAEQAGFGIDRIVVQQWSSQSLPHGDNIVDLVVLAKPGDEAPVPVSSAEVLRVLRPQGAAVLRLQAAKLHRWADRAVCENSDALPNGWAMIRKPEPEGLDDWSLWEHGPDNNPVSADQKIKAPT